MKAKAKTMKMSIGLLYISQKEADMKDALKLEWKKDKENFIFQMEGIITENGETTKWMGLESFTTHLEN